MSVTEKLLRVYRVDQQIEGLRSRLKAAEKFLGDQVKQLQHLDQQRNAVQSQLRQLQAAVANDEGEASRLEERINGLKAQMNAATNNKQYQAFLAEVKTLEAQKKQAEESALKHMEKVEALQAQLAEMEAKSADTSKVRDHADQDRAKRAEEIRDRLNELQAEREKLAADVPADALQTYESLRSERGEDAMAPLIVVDRKRHEYICGSTMMSVPMEVASSLLQGKLTRSPNDGTILYLNEEAAEALQPSAKR